MTYDNDEEAKPLWLVGYGSLLFKPPLHDKAISKSFKKFPGYLSGFARRFWQSSYDNRGTPEQKGRVVTIIPAAEIASHDEFKDDILHYELHSQEHCNEVINNAKLLHNALKVWGCIYYIPPKYAREASEYLDFREKDGYSSHKVSFNVVLHSKQEQDPRIQSIMSKLPKNKAGEPVIDSIVYVGTIENESFVGPENVKKTADIIRVCKGDSGPNIEYLLGLNDAMKDLDPSGRNRSHDPYLEDLVNFVEKN